MPSIERVRDESGAHRWLALASECVPVDHPRLSAGSLEELLHQISGKQRAVRYEHFLAVNGELDAAYGTARLPLRDNLTNAHVQLSVLPRMRRQGIGTALAKELFSFLRSDGRTTAVWMVGSPLHAESGGGAFSTSLGARRVQSRIRRELDLSTIDESKLSDIRERWINGRDKEYEIITWIDRAPDDIVDGVAELVARMSTDAPHGDLSWEPEVWDSSRWREKEDDAAQSGRRRLAASAVDRQGRVVAFTDIGIWARESTVAEQWNTIVDHDHRGHRLGLATKLADLRQLRQRYPQSLRLETWNALENSRMTTINEALGFVAVECVDEYQLAL